MDLVVEGDMVFGLGSVLSDIAIAITIRQRPFSRDQILS